MAPLPIRTLKTHKSHKGHKKDGHRRLHDEATIEEVLRSLPASINWAAAGKTTPIKNQNNCNSCYAFSAIGALESAIMIAHNVTLGISEQEIIDCSNSKFGNNACVGGQPSYVYDYIMSEGINTMANYPQMLANTSSLQECRTPTGRQTFRGIADYDFPDANIIGLLKALQVGPVAVNHYVPDAFKYYLSGIFDSADCFHQTQIDHSTLLVGYNFNHDTPHFILKNSYGIRWGEAGYYRVPIGPLNYENPGFCYMASNGYNVIPKIHD
jgi:cathepsin L